MKFGYRNSRASLLNLNLRRFSNHYSHPKAGLRAQKQFTSRIRKLLVFSTLGATAYVIYTRVFESQIELLYHPTDFNKEVIGSIRELRHPVYQKTFYFPIRFMEIIYGNVWDQREYLEYDREIIHCKDGENIAVGWIKRLGTVERSYGCCLSEFDI